MNKQMIFVPVKLQGGDDWPDRWTSECKTYNIASYTFKSDRGEPARPVPEYFVGYRRIDGKRMTDDLSTKQSVMNVLEELRQ